MLLIARQSGSAAEGSRTDREDQEDQVRDPDPARLLLAAAERSGRSRLWIVADRDTRLGEMGSTTTAPGSTSPSS